MLDLTRYSTLYSPQNNFSGNVAIRSPSLFTIQATFANTSDKQSRIMTGVTTLYTNSTMKWVNTGYQNKSLSYEQNITAIDPSFTLTITPQGAALMEVSGNNTGLVGGITLLAATVPATASATQPVVFIGSNAMSSVVNVSSGAYAGLQFAIDSGALARLTFANGAALGLESNTAVTIDLSAAGINKDIWLGSVKGAVYSGNLTPYANTYRFGGGGSSEMNPLVLATVNALSGARDVQLGDPTSLLPPGALVLAASNSFTGGITLNSARCATLGSTSPNASPTLIARAAGALGTGPILINRASTVGAQVPTLQIEVPYLVFTNSITITNAQSSAAINTVGPLTLRGNLTVYGTSNSLSFMNVNSNNALVVLDQVAAGNAVSFVGQNGILNVENGLFDMVSSNNLPMNIGFRVNAGTLLLSPGFTWSNLVKNGRTWWNTSSPTSGQWVARNFAARGATQVIDGSGAFQPGATNNWLGNGISLGSANTNADGTFYANAGIKMSRDLDVSGLFSANVVNQGPGYTNGSSSGVIQELSGVISGTGVFTFVGSGPTPNDGQVAELVLSGASQWTGGYCWDYQGAQRIMTGPGGLNIGATGGGGNPVGFIRFNGNASLPSGYGGSNSYMVACGRTGSGPAGYLLTGNAGNQVYTLANGVRFLLGGAGSFKAILGSAIGQATLSDGMVSIYNSASNATVPTTYIVVRDTNSTFTLGSAIGSVRFSSCYSGSNSLGMGWYSSTNVATPLFDRFMANTLVKRGPGTLVLSNVHYTLVDGTGDSTTNFNWQLGSGTAGLYDGVVKETGTTVSNSLRMTSLIMNGGIMGLSADYAPVLGTNAVNGNVFNMAFVPGAGFAAYGGKRTVTLTPRSSNLLTWGDSNPIDPNFFMAKGEPLLLSAIDADSPIVISSAYTNYISFGTGASNVEFRVYDNPATNTDEAIIAMRISSAGGSNLVKTGAGTLTLTATNNDWYGTTAVSNGTLNINGVLLGTNCGVFVYTGATLGGTGTVRRAVTVSSNGVITAGAAGQIGTLTISSNLVLNSGSIVSVDVGGSNPGQYDVISVGGSSAVSLTGASLVMTSLNGYDLQSGGNIPIMTSSNGFGGTTFASVLPHGYSVRLYPDANTLSLHRDSPGFIFRIQ